jgi:diguanylate cyclase (GGDEF)-like protein/PAS domain S-box-containing protein
VAAGLWVLTSGYSLARLVPDQRQLIAAQTVRGCGFVVVSAVALFLLIRALAHRLRTGESVYRIMVESNPDLVCRFLPDSTLTYVNEAYARFFEHSPEALVGRPFLDLVPTQARPQVRAMLDALSPDGEPYSHVHEVVGPRGSTRWAEWRNHPIRDAQGRFVEYQAVGRDITEQRRTEQALQEARSRLQLQLERTPIGCVMFDRDVRISYWNPAAERIFGFSAAEAVGRSAFELLVPPSAQGKTREIAARIAAGDTAAHSVNENTTRDGRTIVCEWFNTPLEDEQGGFTGVLSMVQDVTERRRTEEQIRLADEVFDSAAEAILVTDAEGRILSVNRAFTATTGYAPEDVVGKNPSLLASGQHDRDFYQNLWASLVDTGRWQGEVWNRRKTGEAYPEWLSITAVQDAEGRPSHYIGIFTDLSERKAADERVRFLAQHDALTELPNRTLFLDRFEHAIAGATRLGTRVALLFLDLDRFKNVNDSLGHQVGDRLLQAVARRLKGCLREVDTVARLGGDEFLILLHDLRSAQAVATVADKLLGVMAGPFEVDGHELTVSPSVGISLYPDDGRDVPTLMKNADAAMYHAKNRGRNNYQFYRDDMNARTLELLALENALRRAIEHQEFRLHYQPQVDLASGRIVGVEALARWPSPEGGMISPARFIPVAEDCGLIVPLGDWVLREACAQARRWQEMGLSPVPVAVNLSALQFRQGGLPARIRTVLTETGLAPEYLELEITESALMHEVEATVAMVQELRDMGLRLSIDDFGTGYSSLSYLIRFPIHKLKVDLSFVRRMVDNPDAAAITKAIIGMAKNLRLKVIAEGVENADQLALLRAQGCEEIQGYYFSAPVPAEDVARMLRADRRLADALAS